MAMQIADATKAISLAIALALLCSSAQGQARAAIYPIGDISIVVPIPDGYVELNEIAGDKRRFESLRTLFRSVVALPNRSIAIFLSQDELNTFAAGGELKISRAFIVTTHKDFENRTISAHDFQAAAAVLRNQGKEYVDTREIGRLAVQGQLNDALDSIRQKNRITPLSIELNQPIPMGVFQDDSQSIGVTHLVSGNVVSGSQKKPVLEIHAGLGTLVKGRIVSFRVTSDFRSTEDFEWVKANAINWYRQFRAVN